MSHCSISAQISTPVSPSRYEARSEKEKYHNVEEYADFRAQVWELRHETPFSFDAVEGLQQAPEDSDDDVRMVSQAVNYTCPITQSMSFTTFKSLNFLQYAAFQHALFTLVS